MHSFIFLLVLFFSFVHFSFICSFFFIHSFFSFVHYFHSFLFISYVHFFYSFIFLIRSFLLFVHIFSFVHLFISFIFLSFFHTFFTRSFFSSFIFFHSFIFIHSFIFFIWPNPLVSHLLRVRWRIAHTAAEPIRRQQEQEVARDHQVEGADKRQPLIVTGARRDRDGTRQTNCHRVSGWGTLVTPGNWVAYMKKNHGKRRKNVEFFSKEAPDFLFLPVIHVIQI